MAEKRAAWISIVAVIGIIMGCFGLLGAIGSASQPTALKMQREMMPEIMKNAQAAAGNTGTAYTVEAMQKMMDKVMNYPSWYNLFCYVSAAVGALAAGFFIYASIMLMQGKLSGLRMFYAALAVCMAFSVVRAVFLVMANPLLGAASAMGSAFALIIYIILLIVALTGSKKDLA